MSETPILGVWQNWSPVTDELDRYRSTKMNVYIFEELNTGKVSQPFTSLRRLRKVLRDANVCGNIYCMTAKTHRAAMGEGWDMPTFKLLADSVTHFPFA